jgi:hypothetical protein
MKFARVYRIQYFENSLALKLTPLTKSLAMDLLKSFIVKSSSINP